MKELDISAIQQFDTKKHIYLEIVGKGNDRHLEAKKKGFFGRLWMKLKLSSASFSKIIEYLKKAEQDTKAQSLNPALTQKLLQKCTVYEHNHHTSIVKELWLFKPIPSNDQTQTPINPPDKKNDDFSKKSDDSTNNQDPPEAPYLRKFKPPIHGQTDISYLYRKGNFSSFPYWKSNLVSPLDEKGYFHLLSEEEKEHLNKPSKSGFPLRVELLVTLNNVTLLDWEKAGSDIQEVLKDFIKDPDNAKAVALLGMVMDQRVRDLNNEVKLSTACQQESFKRLVSIADLLEPWDKSKLRINLLNEQEFRGLTLCQILDFSWSDHEAFHARLIELLHTDKAQLPAPELQKDIPIEKREKLGDKFAFTKELQKLTINEIQDLQLTRFPSDYFSMAEFESWHPFDILKSV